jgi:hypothetical protein
VVALRVLLEFGLRPAKAQSLVKLFHAFVVEASMRPGNTLCIFELVMICAQLSGLGKHLLKGVPLIGLIQEL